MAANHSNSTRVAPTYYTNPSRGRRRNTGGQRDHTAHYTYLT